MANHSPPSTKQEATDRAREALSLPRLGIRRGSTILKEFFESVAERMELGLDPSLTMPQMGQAIVESAGLAWGPRCESTGSTVTLIGLQRIEEAVRRHVSRVGTHRVDPEVVDAIAVAAAREDRQRGQGYLQNTPLRIALGHYAEKRARDLYASEGWKAEIVGDTQSYDVHCSRGPKVLYVEAKATLGEGAEVLLTFAEVEHARSEYPNTALVVVSGIGVDVEAEPIELSGGEIHRISPWLPEEQDLQPIQYRYRVPREGA